jgi:hypothetical protein
VVATGRCVRPFRHAASSDCSAGPDGRQHDARDLATQGVELAPKGGYGLIAATLQRARINGTIGDKTEAIRDLAAGQLAYESAGEPEWPDDHFSLDRPKIAFYSSGTFAQLGMPVETTVHAAEVVHANEDPSTRNYWPMRTANARIEWAMALTRQGDEDAAVGMAARALDPQWLRPDTDRRTRKLLGQMRDPQLRTDLANQLAAAWATASKLRSEG